MEHPARLARAVLVRARPLTGTAVWPARRDSNLGEGVTEPTADAWMAAWEAEAAQDGLERGAAYWEAGWEWITEEREHRVRP